MEIDNKYNIPISQTDFNEYLVLLKNNIYKILCSKEEEKDWEKLLQTIILELTGLYNNFNKPSVYIRILNKLESLFNVDDKFFRKTIFEVLNLLDGELKNE